MSPQPVPVVPTPGPTTRTTPSPRPVRPSPRPSPVVGVPQGTLDGRWHSGCEAVPGDDHFVRERVEFVPTNDREGFLYSWSETHAAAGCESLVSLLDVQAKYRLKRRAGEYVLVSLTETLALSLESSVTDARAVGLCERQDWVRNQLYEITDTSCGTRRRERTLFAQSTAAGELVLRLCSPDQNTDECVTRVFQRGND